MQEHAGIKWADRVIAVSSATSRECQWMYSIAEEKITSIGNGVDARRFDIELKPERSERARPVVFFCGRLTMQKGPDILINAIPTVLKAHPRAQFVLAGDGDMRESLEHHVSGLGIRESTRFVGHRNGEQLINLFHQADVVCVPSRNEPFGIVVLEAWSARKPVVVTDTGGPREYVRHDVNGLKIYPTSDSVAWGLRTVLDQPERGRWMGENGRKLVETDYGWEKIARQTERVYDPDATGHYRVPADEDGGTCIDDDSQAEFLHAPSKPMHSDRGLTSCVLTMNHTA